MKENKMPKANLSWITDNLATGGDLSLDPVKAAGQMQNIISQGIDCVIDTRQEDDDTNLWVETDIEYLRLPTTDREGHTIPERVFDAAVMAARAVIDNEGGKVFAHCHMGVNRGPSVAYAILLDQGMDTVEAFDLIRAKRVQASIAYAPDALLAHLLRKDTKSVPMQKQITRLRKHMESIWTPEEKKRISHLIRKGHQKDRDEWQRITRANQSRNQ